MTREDEIREKNKRLKHPEKYSLTFPQDQSGFSVEDYQEIRWAVIDKVIRPKGGDWEIKEIATYKGYMGEQIDTVLVHKSVTRLNYDSDGVLIWNPGTIHYKRAFIEEEWTEIENILNEQRQEEIPQDPTIQYQSQQEESPLWIKVRGFFYYRGNKR